VEQMNSCSLPFCHVRSARDEKREKQNARGSPNLFTARSTLPTVFSRNSTLFGSTSTLVPKTPGEKGVCDVILLRDLLPFGCRSTYFSTHFSDISLPYQTGKVELIG
jgi:hypothetical protein